MNSAFHAPRQLLAGESLVVHFQPEYLHAADRLFRSKCLEELKNRSRMAGQNEFWGNLAERLENESAEVRTRVRQSETIRHAPGLAKRNQIEVEWAGLVQHFLRLAAKLPL